MNLKANCYNYIGSGKYDSSVSPHKASKLKSPILDFAPPWVLKLDISIIKLLDMNIDHEPLISLNLAEGSKRRERKPKRPRFIEENDENANERSDRFIIYFLLIYYTVKAIGWYENLILFSTYAFAYNDSIEISRQSDRILFSYHAIATTVYFGMVRNIFLATYVADAPRNTVQ